MKRQLQWKTIDNFKRKLFLKVEVKRALLRSFITNKNLPLVYRYYSLYSFAKISRITSVTRQVNRCTVDGRPWYVVKQTKYSRFRFRTEAYQGHLPGFSRASW